MQVGIPLLLIGSMAVFNSVLHGGTAGPLVELRDFGLLPFEHNAPFGKPSTLIMLYFLGGAGLIWPSGMTGYQDVLRLMLRHLRTLPLSTRTLNALLLTLPIVSWINLWLVMLLLHVAVGAGPIGSLRLADWLAMFGIDAVIRAMYHRWRSYFTTSFLLIALFVTLLIVTKFASGSLQTIALAVGAVALVAAWAINDDTLRRSRTAYSKVLTSPSFPATPL